MILLALIAYSQRNSPFAPPSASLHYAPDRTCDLLHVSVDLDVDYADKTYRGHVTNTMSPLREGIREIRLMAGTVLTISSVTLDGKTVKYRRDGRNLFIETPQLTKGKPVDIGIDYVAKNSHAQSFGGEGGFHWIEPGKTGKATRVGFWTQGETEYNSDWAPTWDYPNDLATSETRCTVPADWQVIGNGIQTENKLSSNGKRRMFHWVMKQPHATYLLTLCGGPFDIKRDKWEGVELWYVVPRGEAKFIDDTFGDTKDMLSYYSNVLGVKYAWPKYAQNAMYDFGGGMENVSATTLGDGELTENRDGYFRAASINSHELGHQWFGDLVTCKDWGDTWLNESFATLMQFLYFEHSRGKYAYDREIETAIQSYLNEAREYKRPLSTKMYPNGDAMFDSHTYPKGGVILHTLRRWLGDDNFFSGLNLYLRTYRNQPVESAQLRRSMTEATGINCEPFWAQWIERPGHPVLDYNWKKGPDHVSVTVKQMQNTSDGTPIYDIWTKIATISDGKVSRFPIHITKAEETFELPPHDRLDSVLLDPDHDFLREIPVLHWAAEELPSILKSAPSGLDRAEAMKRLLGGTPSTENILAVADAVRTDRDLFPAFRSVRQLADLAREDLRPFWQDQLSHPNFERRADAIQALGKLESNADVIKQMRDLVNDKAPIPVVLAAIQVLKTWDAKGNADVFNRAKTIPSRSDRIKHAAAGALGE